MPPPPMSNRVNADLASLGFLLSICETFSKYDLLHHFQLWFSQSIFFCYKNWKVIVITKIPEKENTNWQAFCTCHPGTQVAEAYLDNVFSHQFCSISNNFQDLVSCLHVQIRQGGNLFED